MKKTLLIFQFALVVTLAGISGCVTTNITPRNPQTTLPTAINQQFQVGANGKNIGKLFFRDSLLRSLIDSALANNQELNVMRLELQIAKNEIQARRGEYMPMMNFRLEGGADKDPLYTRQGALVDQLEVLPGRRFPDPLGNYIIAGNASWEIDVWKKLRNAKKSAATRYLAGVEGRNFMITNLVNEIAVTYYELLALDQLNTTLEQNAIIQNEALQVSVQQKNAGRITQLAVNRFEAQLLNTQTLQYQVKQRITLCENRINFLVGRFPQHVNRDTTLFYSLSFDTLAIGVPSALLQNRPDIRQAELELEACKLDVKVARANFYPSVRLTAAIGLQAFNPMFLSHPESILIGLAGELVAPAINRNAIKALYNTANARQLQAVFAYEQSIINGITDVINQLSNIKNCSSAYQLKEREVSIQNNSVQIATGLFNSARADYSEVLLTQREALDAKIELTEIKLEFLLSHINLYRSLGGGW